MRPRSQFARIRRALVFEQARDHGPAGRAWGAATWYLKRRWTAPPVPPPALNVNGAAEEPGRPAALLAYLSRPFHWAPDDPRLLGHQNLRQCRQIAGLLGELGYVVDAVEKRDLSFRPPREYDLVVSERLRWRGLDQHFRPEAPRLFLATSLSHTTHNRNLLRRHELLAARRTLPVRPRRIYDEDMPAVATADGVAAFGNDLILDTWAEHCPGASYAFNNYGFDDAVPAPIERDLVEAGRHFLFFASASQVQKGLDLLLEVFPRRPDLHLYVCSGFAAEEDFCACYRSELFDTPNVHPIGWVGMKGSAFAELARRCAYVIHPTCSEGQPGSVVHCMHAGLIPMVTPEAGIDVEGFGVTLESDDLDALEQTIAAQARRPPDWLAEHGERTRTAARERFSEEAFLARWREILAGVLRARERPAGSRDVSRARCPRARGGPGSSPPAEPGRDPR